MPLKTQQAAIARLYVPSRCDMKAIDALTALVGGVTILSGLGEWWDRRMEWHKEPVLVYEYVITGRKDVKDLVKSTGKDFLEHNPGEQEFLAVTITSAGTRSITITRKEAA